MRAAEPPISGSARSETGEKSETGVGLKAEVFGNSNPELRTSCHASRAFPASLARLA